MYSVAFSPDAITIASGSRDGTIILWDMNTRRQRARFEAHDVNDQFIKGVTTIAFDPTGHLLVSGGYDRSVKLWDIRNGRVIWASMDHDAPVTSVVFDPSGEAVISGSYDGRIIFWNVQTGSKIKELKAPSSVRAVAISPDRRRVAAAVETDAYLFDLATGSVLGTLESQEGYLTTISFSRDGTMLTAGTVIGTVVLWSIGEQKRLASLRQHQGSVSCVSFNPDGTRLASASDDGSIVIWNVEKKEPIHSLQGHHREVSSVAFSADGHHFVSGAYDKTVILWDLGKDAAHANLKGHAARSSDVSFAQDGKTLASGGWDSKVILWDIRSLRPIAELGPHSSLFDSRQALVESVSFSVDGKTIAAGHGTSATLWDASAARVETRLQGGKGEVFSVAFSPTSGHVATATDRLEVVIWKADTGQAQQVLDAQKGSKVYFHGQHRGNISFSPDGKLLAYWDSGDAVILWHVERRLPVAELKGHTRIITNVAFSPNGKILASSGQDQRVILWDVSESRRIGELKERDEVTSIAFSPDGEILAAATGGSKTTAVGRVTLWDVNSLRQLGIVLDEGDGAWFKLAFSPVYPRLAIAGSWDRTVKIWDVDPENWKRQICRTVSRVNDHLKFPPVRSREIPPSR